MNYDTHDPDNTPEDESMEWDGEYPDHTEPEYPEIDASNEENYDSEDDTWSDADTLTSIGWGTDEDYGYYGEDN